MTLSSRLRWFCLILLLQAALVAVLLSERALKREILETPPAMLSKPGEGVPVIIKKLEFRDQASLKNWEEKIFKGKTVYRVAPSEKGGFLEAVSSDASSGLYSKMDLKISPDMFISWKWRATVFPEKKKPEQLSNRGEDDFAARIYLVFPGSNFFNTDVIEYIWDRNLPVDTVASSPFSSRVKLFVVRNGEAPQDGSWQSEERNPYADYEKLFQRKPERPIGAIALMSDSDNTRTRSEAAFSDIVFKLKNQTTEASRS